MFYTEPEARKATVPRFLPTLLRVIHFNANPAAQPLAQALQWLHEKPDHDPPTAIVGKAWQRHVVQDGGRINATAYSFCALDKLRSAIRRRNVQSPWLMVVRGLTKQDARQALMITVNHQSVFVTAREKIHGHIDNPDISS